MGHTPPISPAYTAAYIVYVINLERLLSDLDIHCAIFLSNRKLSYFDRARETEIS